MLAILWCARAEAATYNFYFNNTEQGPGSTASPTVTVKTDEAKATEEEDEEEEEKEKLPLMPEAPGEALPEPTLPATGSVAKAETAASSSRHRMFRLGAFLTSVRKGAYERDDYWGDGYGRWRSAAPAPTSASYLLTFLPSPYVGFSVMAGSLKGVETELNLLPSNFPLTFGLLLGYGRTAEMEKSVFHWGMQLGLDLADRVGLQFLWRDFGKVADSRAAAVGAYLKF